MSITPFPTVASPRWRWIASRLLALLLVLWTLVLFAWLALHWGILPRIGQWREPIEQRASAALGIPVRIGEIVVHSRGWVPALELRDVVLLDREQRPALTLARVDAALSPRSLLALDLRFEQLHLQGVQLEVRRDALGRVFVAGLEMGQAAGNSEATDWFLRQREFVIRGGSIRWTDERRLAPPLQLTDVDLVVRNGLREHEVRLDATPEAAWGDRFTLRGRFTRPLLARPGEWQRWTGQLYADLPRADVRELRRHVPLPFELSEGDGALRAWVDVADGELRGLTADVALRAVAMRLATHVAPLVVERVQGRIVGQRDAQGGSLAVQRLSFATGDGVQWPEGDLAVRWKQRAGEGVSGGEWNTDRLDLAALAQVAEHVPLGETLRRLLAEAEPQGQLIGFGGGWDGPIDAPTRWRAKGLISGLNLKAQPRDGASGIGRPGLRNATVQINADSAGGDARIGLDAGALELPGVFEEPAVGFDRFTASLAWKTDAQGWRLQLKDAVFANADLQGTLGATWAVDARTPWPGTIELDGKLGRVNALRVPHYLPRSLGPTRSYLERAVRGGTLAGATVRVKGRVADIPFARARTPAEGELRIALRAEDLEFAYVPDRPASGTDAAWVSPWPALTQVKGDIVIDRQALAIRNARGRIGGFDWTSIKGEIAALGEAPVLNLEGEGSGPAGEVLRFIAATPVARWTRQALTPASATGNLDLRLALALPLKDLPTSRVNGSATLAGNDLRLRPDWPQLAQARGRIDFSEAGFSIAGATAKAMGGDVQIDAERSDRVSGRLQATGVVTAEALRRGDWPALARLGGVLSGQTTYRLALAWPNGLPEMQFTSPLVGLSIDAPLPLRKAAETPMPLLVQTSAGSATTDTLRVELGTLLAAHWQRDLSGDTPRVLRGAIAVQEPLSLPTAPGVSAAISLPLLRVDDWRAFADRLGGGDDGAEAGGYLPQRVALRSQRVHAGDRRLDRVVAGASHESGVWRVNVDAEQLDGYLEYRPAAGSVAPRLMARLARLSVPRSDVEQVESLLEPAGSQVPALDIVVEQFELRGKKLGRLEAEAVHRVPEGNEAGREWRLTKLNLTVPEARLTATGSWARRSAAMNFKLDVSDSGALLDRLGTPRAVRGGRGALSGQIGWTGSPLAIDYPSLSGRVNVAVDAGQFLKADAGAARLLGVLSLQSLPRRLALDFRDVFNEGFAFDNLTGDVTIESGVARTNNLRMRGVQAAVLMEGRADIAKETQDLRVVVVPEINAGTASLAYAAINPAVGIGTFLAQWLLRRPLTAAGTREFQVTGPWADPKVERVERGPNEAVPDVDQPLPPAPRREPVSPEAPKEPGG